jgi:2',3'-cyclic-nucleotide 2'-phosphodiesterase (5'-nucleotidase family)
MNRRLRVPALLVGLILAIGTGCSREAIDAPPRTATICFQGDVGGSFESQPTADGTAGGATRFVAWLRRQPAPPPIAIDAGDRIGRDPFVRPSELGTALTTADVAIEVLNRANVDAFVPGEGDLGIGWEELRKRLRRAGFPVLAANLRDAYLGGPPFPGSAIVHRGDVRVGLIGVVSPTLAATTEAAATRLIALDDPVAAVQRELRTIRPDVDLLVVIAHLDVAEIESLARQVAGIDFILAGHAIDRAKLADLPRGAPPVMQSGANGRDVGVLQVALRGKDRPLVDVSAAPDNRETLSRIDAELNDWRQKAGGADPLRHFAADAKTVARIKEIREMRRSIQAEVSAIAGRSTFFFAPHLLGYDVSPDPETAAAIESLTRTSSGPTAPAPGGSAPLAPPTAK